MRPRLLLVPGAFVTIAVALVGCGSGADAAPGAGEGVSAPVQSSGSPTVVAEETAALAQAQAWLDAANLPPGAVRTDFAPSRFTSYTGWPCGPYERLEGFWVVPDTTVVDAANWLIENPTADLMTTNPPVSEEWGPIDSATVGYVPTPDAQEGIVYTLAKKDDDVAIRAEVAAQTGSATCPPLPDGSRYGAPGQG